MSNLLIHKAYYYLTSFISLCIRERVEILYIHTAIRYVTEKGGIVGKWWEGWKGGKAPDLLLSSTDGQP